MILLVALGLASIAIGIAHWQGWKSTGWWIALTIIGFAATLQLVHAGPGIRYPRFQPWDIGDKTRLLALLLLTGQTVITAAFWYPRLKILTAQLRQRVRWWQIVLFAAFVIVTSAVPSRDLVGYAAELLVAPLVQLVALGSVGATVVSLPTDGLHRVSAWSRSLLGGSDGYKSASPSIDAFAVSAALWVTIVCAFLAITVYQRHPHVPDEVSYLFQARYFAQGALWMPAPPVPPAFDVDLMIYQPTRWFAPNPPGWPAVLAIGAWFGVPWLVNPILAGINVVLAYTLVWRLYGKPTARLTILFLATSPWYLFLGMSFMTHTLTFAAAAVAALVVWNLRQGRSTLWAILGGAGLALLGTIRPLEGLIVSALLGLWSLGGLGRSLVHRVTGLGVLAASAMALGTYGLWYNSVLTGGPLTFPLMTYFDEVYGVGSNALGFGPNIGAGWVIDAFHGHSLVEAVLNMGLNLPLVNTELLGWPTGCFILIAAMLLWGRLSRTDWWLVGFVVTVIMVHWIYWFAGGPDFGARYWYLILLPLLMLSARAVLAFSHWEGASRGGHEEDVRPLVGSLVLTGLALTLFIPWRATDKYFHYRGMRPDIRTLAAQHDFGRSLVLVRGARAPDYASAVTYNPIDLEAPVPIYVWDRGPVTDQPLAAAFPDRPVWIVEGPTRTGDGFRVVAGPLPPGETLAERHRIDSRR